MQVTEATSLNMKLKNWVFFQNIHLMFSADTGNRITKHSSIITGGTVHGYELI